MRVELRRYHQQDRVAQLVPGDDGQTSTYRCDATHESLLELNYQNEYAVSRARARGGFRVNSDAHRAAPHTGTEY